MATLLLNNKNVTEKIDTQGYTRITENGILMDYTASAIRFSVSGQGETKVLFHLTTGEIPNFAVYVNKKLAHDFLKPTQEKEGLYALSFLLDESENEIEIVRKSECVVGCCEALSIETTGELLKVQKPTKVIDFLGDSITAAGACFKRGEEFFTSANNSYAYITAKKLGFGYNIRAKSGSGFMMSYGGKSGIGFSWDETYKIENYIRSETEPYIPQRKIDIACIYLGTNDMGQNWGKTKEERNELFVPKMEELIKTVREYNGNVPVIWIAGGMTKAYMPQVEKAIANLGGEKEKLYVCEVTSGLSAGGAGHPNCEQHEQIANELVSFIKNNVKTG